VCALYALTFFLAIIGFTYLDFTLKNAAGGGDPSKIPIPANNVSVANTTTTNSVDKNHADESTSADESPKKSVVGPNMSMCRLAD
jgi:hypothetical protein